MDILQLSPDNTLHNWPIIAPLLERARDTSQQESSLADYMRKVLSGNAQCWIVIDDSNNIIGAGLTEILKYAQHTTLHILVFADNDFEQQSKVFPKVEEFAKAQGCIAIEQWGRAGWAKVLPKYIPGFKPVYVVMRKNIGDSSNEILQG